MSGQRRARRGQVRDHAVVETFSCPGMLLVVGVFQFVVGALMVGLAVAAVVTRSAGVAVVFGGIGGLLLGVGTRALRSKVIVDQTGMHIRTTLRWLDLDWPTVNGFVIERRRLNARQKWHVVVVVVRPIYGKAIASHALASWEYTDALSRLKWLQAKQLEGCGMPPNQLIG